MDFRARLQRAFHRLGAAVGEVDAREGRGQQSGESGGKASLRLDNVFAVHHHVQMTAHLTFDGGDDGGMPMAQRAHPDPAMISR